MFPFVDWISSTLLTKEDTVVGFGQFTTLAWLFLIPTTGRFFGIHLVFVSIFSCPQWLRQNPKFGKLLKMKTMALPLAIQFPCSLMGTYQKAVFMFHISIIDFLWFFARKLNWPIFTPLNTFQHHSSLPRPRIHTTFFIASEVLSLLAIAW